MESRNLILIIILFLIAFSAVKLSKALRAKVGKTSDKNTVNVKENLVLKSGIVGMCLGVGVGSALKDMFSEDIILIIGVVGATIGAVIGITIKRRTKS